MNSPFFPLDFSHLFELFGGFIVPKLNEKGRYHTAPRNVLSTFFMIAVELYTISMVSALLPVAGMFVILNSASISRNLTWEVSEFVGLWWYAIKKLFLLGRHCSFVCPYACCLGLNPAGNKMLCGNKMLAKP